MYNEVTVQEIIKSQRIVGVGTRTKDDFYPTPRRGIESLCAVEQFEGPIWEPACGTGSISSVLSEKGYEVISSDLLDRGYGENRIDFLMEWQARAPNIVTNPPFNMATDFVEKALSLSTGKVAFLLKIQFLEGLRRAHLFKPPFARVWVFRSRLTLTKGDQQELKGGGMMTFAWFIWEHGYQAEPVIRWL